MIAPRVEPHITVWPTWLAIHDACPRRYRNACLLRVPALAAATPPAAARGSAVHAELRARHEDRERHASPRPAVVGGERFDRLVGRHLAVCPWSTTPGARYQGGERTLSWAIPDRGVLLLGRADALWELPDGTIEVRDYRTGGAADPDEDERAGLYGLLARAMWPERPVRVVYERLEGQPVVASATLDGDRLAATLHRVIAHAEAVRAARTWPARPGRHCLRCPYRSSCPEAGVPGAGGT